MDKSAAAFRTISEVAEHLETPAHVLRFWESRFPQIKPVKRAGGRRYYRPSDVALLTGIKRLLHDEGMTIRGVQKILREQGVRHVAGLSGDMPGEDAEDAAFEGDIAEAAAPVPAEPAPFRPLPGLAAAMAKAVDRAPLAGAQPAAPSTPLPTAEPAQGALLLTPILMPETEPLRDAVGHVAASTPDIPLEISLSAADQPSQDGDLEMSEALTMAQDVFPESPGPDGDFGDDDFDQGPAATLASRIRALPPEASGAKVAAELLDVVARLQALRDTMANAARTGAA